MSDLAGDIRNAIRDVPDFPKLGVVFKDITPVLLDAALFRRITEALAGPFVDGGVTHVVGIESRGFILAAPVAQLLNAGFVPMRKPGKLPWMVQRIEYALEYGVDALEVHRDAVGVGDRVLVVDDVLATGGTARAACELIESLGAEVAGCSFLIAIAYLRGTEALGHRPVKHILST